MKMSLSNAVDWVGLGSMQAQQVPWTHVLHDEHLGACTACHLDMVNSTGQSCK